MHDVVLCVLCVAAGDGNNGELDLTGIDDEELDKVCWHCCCFLPQSTDGLQQVENKRGT